MALQLLTGWFRFGPMQSAEDVVASQLRRAGMGADVVWTRRTSSFSFSALTVTLPRLHFIEFMAPPGDT